MARLFCIPLISLLLFSCSEPTGIKDLAETADSVAINVFRGDGTMDTVLRVVMIRDKEQVKKLAGHIESAVTENYKCGYDGSLHFFKKDAVLQDVDFRMNQPGCMHFSFVIKGKIYATKLSNEAKGFLGTLINPR